MHPPHSRRHWKVFAAGLALSAALGAAFLAGRALAGGIPSTGALTYSGTLEDATGNALTGSHNIQVNFWSAATGGTTPVCLTTSASVTLDNGRFSVALPDGANGCVSAVKASPDVWAEVLVDGASLGRTKIGAVPYAVEAGHATNADNATNATNATTAATANASGGNLASTISQLQSQVGASGIWAANPAPGCTSIDGGTNWTTIPGTTVTFSLSAPSTVWATYSINVQPSGATTLDYVSFQLVVDGTASSMSGNHIQPNTSNDANYTTTGNYVGTLAAGSHTITLQWTATADVSSPPSWSNCYGGTWSAGSQASPQTSIGQRSVVVTSWHQ